MWPRLKSRDKDWILAMAEALGSDSGFVIPIVPEARLFEELFEAVGKAAVCSHGVSDKPEEKEACPFCAGELTHYERTHQTHCWRCKSPFPEEPENALVGLFGKPEEQPEPVKAQTQNAMEPCPFCKGEDIRPAPRRGFPVWAHCNTCGCEGPEKLTGIEADAAWNKRAERRLAPDSVSDGGSSKRRHYLNEKS